MDHVQLLQWVNYWWKLYYFPHQISSANSPLGKQKASWVSLKWNKTLKTSSYYQFLNHYFIYFTSGHAYLSLFVIFSLWRWETMFVILFFLFLLSLWVKTFQKSCIYCFNVWGSGPPLPFWRHCLYFFHVTSYLTSLFSQVSLNLCLLEDRTGCSEPCLYFVSRLATHHCCVFCTSLGMQNILH